MEDKTLHLLDVSKPERTLCGIEAFVINTATRSEVNCEPCRVYDRQLNWVAPMLNHNGRLDAYELKSRKVIPMDHNRTTSTSIQLVGTVTADELRRMIEDIPDRAVLSASYYAGDMREASYTTLTFTW